MSRELILFTSPTCGPCKLLKPRLAEIAAELGITYHLIELDASNRTEFGRRDVRSVPVLMCVEGDKEIGRFGGNLPEEAIRRHLIDWGVL